MQTATRLFKFKQRVNLDRSLAYYMVKALPLGEHFDLIVPVPLHKSALRERGYNQATLLARELGRMLACRVESRLLRKIRKTIPQHNLPARERENNLSNAFSLVAPLSGEHILLVDDVLTTGATVGSCSQSLLAGGAGKVTVVTVARAG